MVLPVKERSARLLRNSWNPLDSRVLLRGAWRMRNKERRCLKCGWLIKSCNCQKDLRDFDPDGL